MQAYIPRQWALLPPTRESKIKGRWTTGKVSAGVRYQSEVVGAPGVWVLWMNRDALGSKAKRCAEPRYPNGQCSNLLFALLGIADVVGSNILPPLSQSKLMELMLGFRGRIPYYVDMLLDNLRLWQQVGIHWPRVMVGGRSAESITLPPPIESITMSRYAKQRQWGYREVDQYNIVLSKEWVEGVRGRMLVGPVNLPLPKYACAQNIILHCLVRGNMLHEDLDQFFARMSGNKRSVGSKVGEGPGHTPYNSWRIAQRWFVKNGGAVDYARAAYRRAIVNGRVRLIPSKTMSITVSRPTVKGTTPWVKRLEASLKKRKRRAARRQSASTDITTSQPSPGAG